MSLRVTDEEYLTLQARTGKGSSYIPSPKTSKPNKYNARRKEVDGIVFASGAEARRWLFLKARMARGEIDTLIRQYEFPFYVKDTHVFSYFADFVYFEDVKFVVEDVKGQRLPLYLLKKRIIELDYGVTITEIRSRR